MADCLLQQGHIVNIPRNSYRMRQHSELRNTLYSQAQEAEKPAPRRARKRRELTTS